MSVCLKETYFAHFQVHHFNLGYYQNELTWHGATGVRSSSESIENRRWGLEVKAMWTQALSIETRSRGKELLYHGFLQCVKNNA